MLDIEALKKTRTFQAASIHSIQRHAQSVAATVQPGANLQPRYLVKQGSLERRVQKENPLMSFVLCCEIFFTPCIYWRQRQELASMVFLFQFMTAEAIYSSKEKTAHGTFLNEILILCLKISVTRVVEPSLQYPAQNGFVSPKIERSRKNLCNPRG